MKRLFCCTIVVFTAANDFSIRPALAGGSEVEISVAWRLIENRPEGRFQAELKLHNDGAEALAGEWALYFNSASKLLRDSVPADFELTHVNGDFYVLQPSAGAKPLEPGDSRNLKWEGEPWAINVSDAPSGFYLIRDARSERPTKPIPVPIRVDQFPEAAKLRRGETDIVPVVTAESRYLENESLRKLPADQLCKVVPTPVEIQPRSGHIWLQSSTKIICETPVAVEATFLANALGELLMGGVALEQSAEGNKAAPDVVNLRIADVEVAGSVKRKGDEAYVLTVNPERGMEIVGSDRAGVFYGAQTLRALLPVESYRQRNNRIEIGAVRIADAPRFRYRGLHLDVARNFQSKQTVEKLLDLMAFYKLNRLHWHLTDDEGWRIEIKKLPELTAVGGHRGHTLDEADRLVPSHGSGPIPDPALSLGSGFYTQEDIVEILRYAQARHIEVIPEVDLPGHARAAVKAMEAHYRKRMRRDDTRADEFLLRDPDDKSEYESVQLWRDNVVDVGREASHHFVATVVDELADIYKRAEIPLTCIHLGGDEVPKGAWEKSPACERIPVDVTTKVPRRSQLELYFLNRASEIVAQHAIHPACWEDCLLVDVGDDTRAGYTRRAAGKPTPIAYVWNNVWGWGAEDAAYRLANAGFDVVLCNATHLYFDLSCEKDPAEPGYYWAGFVGVRAPFEFVPLDIFMNAGENAMGQPVSEKSLAGRVHLTPEGEQHILGIQGQLWSENLRDARRLEYMAFPRMMTLAERAWSRSPGWAQIIDPQKRRVALDRDWNQFANRLGQRELTRLDYLNGGVHYRLPPPGAVVRGGMLHANVALPGLEIRYTLDGTEPDATSALYRQPVSVARDMKLRSFDTRGRSSRTVNVAAQGQK